MRRAHAVAVFLGLVVGRLLTLRTERAYRRAGDKIGADLGTTVAARWKEADERDRKMLDHTNGVRRVTWVLAALTVINTGFVIYSALR